MQRRLARKTAALFELFKQSGGLAVVIQK